MNILSELGGLKMRRYWLMRTQKYFMRRLVPAFVFPRGREVVFLSSITDFNFFSFLSI